MTKEEQKERRLQTLFMLACASWLGALTGCILGMLRVPFPIKIAWLGLM